MRTFAAVALLCLLALIVPVQAADQITYISQPDEVYIFLNDVAFAYDTITLPGGVDVQIALPATVFETTLMLREDGQRVTSYRLRRDTGVMLEWATGAGDGAREVTLEYLMAGLSWTPRYDMTLNGDPADSADFSFFAEVTNAALELDTVTAHLIAGRVDLSQPVDDMARATVNQYIAGYDEAGAPAGGEVGAATIQYIYEPGSLTSEPGETLYQSLLQVALPVRRILLWNAETDPQVTVIYKLKNEANLPLAEGVVRNYQNGIFIGSDWMETTPVGSEGSITVGKLQDVRVNRSESQTALVGVFYSYQHQVELTLENFGAQPVTLDVVDRQRADAENLMFSAEPARETGNLLRWTVTLAPGEKQTIQYEFQTR
ncbi:MAG: DUF4139 domain-containing protein [Chloroflexi bacterium]|nr:DUF4139 domain-containing protein [Chloroflexota bacterium]